jgi:curved DNA-binding protein CbpA
MRMKLIPSYYDVLGLTSVATNNAILERIAQERARINILKRIPAKRAEAERLLAELEAAAAVLLDPEARKRYDESLGMASGSDGNPAAPISGSRTESAPASKGATAQPEPGNAVAAAEIGRRELASKPPIVSATKNETATPAQEKRPAGPSAAQPTQIPKPAAPPAVRPPTPKPAASSAAQAAQALKPSPPAVARPPQATQKPAAPAAPPPASKSVVRPSAPKSAAPPAAQTRQAPESKVPAATQPPQVYMPEARFVVRPLPLPQKPPAPQQEAQPTNVRPEPPAPTVQKSAPLQADSEAASGQRPTNSPRLAIGVIAACILAATIYFVSQKTTQHPPLSQAATPTPINTATPGPTSTPTPSQVVDLRPPQVSLLNPPLIGASLAAARDPRMAQGEVKLQHIGDDFRVAYPGGRIFVIDRKLYNPTHASEPHYASDYGTWVVQTNVQNTGGTTWEFTLQLSALGDINGDGWPEVVLEDSGPGHCCVSLVVLSFRPEGPAVVFARQLNSATASMQDLNGDGRKEILTEQLFESALGSFSGETIELPIAYSAGSDGVYRANTQAFKNWLQTGYQQERAKSAETESGSEEHNTRLMNLFLLAYLAGNNEEAYSYLGQLQSLAGREHPLMTLRARLVDVAPEVVQEPAFQQALAALRSTPQPANVVASAPQPKTQVALPAQPATTPVSPPDVVQKAAIPPSPTPSPAAESQTPAHSETPQLFVQPHALSNGMPAGYSGPMSGHIIWRGVVEKRGEITFDGAQASIGTVDGELPGVRVVINLDTKNYALVEYPSERNGWKHFKIRSNHKEEAIIIPWQVVR